MKQLILKFDNKELILKLRNTKTAHIIYNALPFKSVVQKWGEEIYFDTPLNINLESNARSVVDYGEIAFWAAGSAIAIGYGRTPVSQENEIRLISPANIWADCKFQKEYISNIKQGETVIVEKL